MDLELLAGFLILLGAFIGWVIYGIHHSKKIETIASGTRLAKSNPTPTGAVASTESTRGTVLKVCPQCRSKNPLSKLRCECGFEFPRSSTELPEFANAQELSDIAAQRGLNVDVSVEEKDGAESFAEDTPPVKPKKPKRKTKEIVPAPVVGQLIHKKIYTFNGGEWGETTTPCHICNDKQWVFSTAVDSAGVLHRCCLRCLNKLGGKEQIERAIQGSNYAAGVWNCIQALDQLVSEFPDPNRRPYGEKTLKQVIEGIYSENTERILHKIREKDWTEYDLARIEGRPEPVQKN
jgi:hypothetical protein